MASLRRWPLIAPILLYAAAGLEMLIMVSPFAAYFYSVYTPLLHGLEQNVATAWLPQFFLPHLAHTQLDAFRLLSFLGALLTLAGLVGFIVCAVQLYYGKFVRKRLVSGGLYGRVRHPQYLWLAIAGLGLLLLWPRFFILVTYLLMLGLYYVLARHEESQIVARYGQPAEAYLASVPMWNPFRGRRPGAAWRPPSPGRAFGTWLVLAIAGLGLAFGLRALAVSQLYAVRSDVPRATAVAFRPMDEARLQATLARVLAEVPLRDGAGDSWYLQVTPGGGQLIHLLVDLGMTPEARAAVDASAADQFVVVSRVVGHSSDPASPPDPLALGARITPVYLMALAGGGEVASVSPLAPEQFRPDFVRIFF